MAINAYKEFHMHQKGDVPDEAPVEIFVSFDLYFSDQLLWNDIILIDLPDDTCTISRLLEITVT